MDGLIGPLPVTQSLGTALEGGSAELFKSISALVISGRFVRKPGYTHLTFEGLNIERLQRAFALTLLGPRETNGRVTSIEKGFDNVTASSSIYIGRQVRFASQNDNLGIGKVVDGERRDFIVFGSTPGPVGKDFVPLLEFRSQNVHVQLGFHGLVGNFEGFHVRVAIKFKDPVALGCSETLEGLWHDGVVEVTAPPAGLKERKRALRQVAQDAEYGQEYFTRTYFPQAAPRMIWWKGLQTGKKQNKF